MTATCLIVWLISSYLEHFYTRNTMHRDRDGVRLTFRRISQDTGKFVRFANGLMNESNALVASVMEKLPEVRAVQLQMKDPAQWGAMTEAQRNEAMERSG